MLKQGFPVVLAAIAFVSVVAPVLVRGISTLKANNPNAHIN
jgi:hypothetical protein